MAIQFLGRPTVAASSIAASPEAQFMGQLKRAYAIGGAPRARALAVVAALRKRQQQIADQRRVNAPAGSGTELARALNTPVAKAIENAIPGGIGTTIASVVSTIAPILDTSLAQFSCTPGHPGYPGCAIPGGSAEAIVAAGATPAEAAAIVRDVMVNGPMGGGGRRGAGVSLRLE